MGKRRLAPEQRRAEILQAAKELFAQQGYDRTQLQEIAARIGASRSVFAPYFSGKEAIYDALFEQWRAQMCQPQTLPIVDGSAVATLRRFIEEYLSTPGLPKGCDPVLQAAIYSRTGYATQVIQVLRERDLVSRCLLPVIEYGQAQGELRQADALRLAQLLMDLLDGAVKNLLVFQLPFDEETIDLALSLFQAATVI